MNKLKKLFFTLTGGRPMKLVSKTSAFYDSIGNIPVGYYRDAFGRVWMGNMVSLLGGWQFGFVRAANRD